MHVGISLATLFPGRVGGSETYVRGLLGAFAAGAGPDRVTVLANRHVMDEYEPSADGRVALHHLRSYRAGDSNVHARARDGGGHGGPGARRARRAGRA